MFKKIFLLLFTVFLTLNCYSDKEIITVQERCKIAYKNLELLNNPHKSIYVREDGKLRKLYYSEILAQRAENEEIIRKFCNQRVEENINNSAKYETRQAIFQPSPNIALEQAIIAKDVDTVLTALEVAAIDYALERTIRALISKEDFDGALAALEEDKKNSKNKNKTTGGIAGSGVGTGYSGFGGVMPPDGGDRNKKTTEHAKQRKEEATTDAHRNVGDTNRVVREGQKYMDTETGNYVYVKGDKVVIQSSNGRAISQFKNSRANTLKRIRNGKWKPL